MADRTYPETLAIEAEATFVFAAAGDEKKPPTFEMAAYNGGPMRVNGWPYPIVIDLAGLKLAKKQVPIRLGHVRDRLVGHTESVAINPTELAASGVISFENMHAREVVSAARNGFKWQASVEVSPGRPEDIEQLAEGDVSVVNGRTVKGPVDIIRKGTLTGIAFVDIGADSTTSARVAAEQHQGEQGTMTKQDENKSGGSEAGGGDGAGTQQRKGVEASGRASGVEAITAAARDEGERQGKITDMVTDALAEPGASIDEIEALGRKAVTERWDVSKAEAAFANLKLEAVRANRARGPSIHARSEQPLNDSVLAAAVLLSLGAKHDRIAKDPDFGERVAEAAWKHRSITLHGLIAAALKADGVTPPHGGPALFQAAMGHAIRAGFSTVNLPGILGNVANKRLLDSFTAVEVVYPRIAQQVEHANFHTHTHYRLNDVGSFAEVGADGEIQHGTLSEESYTNRVTTKGQMLTLTRQDIINDDLGALDQLTGILGRKAALAVERATIDIILEGSDVMFTSGNGNKQTSSALSLTTLGTAEALMMAQLDADSEPIYATPRILLVPPGLKALAEQIYTSTTVVGGSSAVPSDNPFKGRFRPECSPYLALSALTGYSATTWYLLADPMFLPAIQVAYLRGQRQPTIETADATFNTLGMQMRCYFDFGVAQVDYRGAVKSVA